MTLIVLLSKVMHFFRLKGFSLSLLYPATAASFYPDWSAPTSDLLAFLSIKSSWADLQMISLRMKFNLSEDDEIE